MPQTATKDQDDRGAESRTVVRLVGSAALNANQQFHSEWKASDRIRE